jgi:hypothetical protein
MPKIPALHPTVRGWLFDGPLAEHVPAYVARLSEGRYAPNTMARSLAALAHFAHWMALSRLSADRLDESRIEQFLHEHLPHCGCAGPAMRHPREAHAALMPLLALLRQRGVISDLPAPSGPIAEELDRYDAHMRDARGLSASTRVNRLRIVQRLLLAKFAGHPLRFDRLSSDDIRHFIAEQLELRNTKSNSSASQGWCRCIRAPWPHCSATDASAIAGCAARLRRPCSLARGASCWGSRWASARRTASSISFGTSSAGRGAALTVRHASTTCATASR